MKIVVSGLCLLSLVSVGLAQAPVLQIPTNRPVAPQVAPPSMPLAYYGQPGAQGMAVSPYAQSVAAAPYGMVTNPAPECCAPMKKVCIPEPATKTISHTCYSKTCAEFCYPKCSCCLASLFGCCSSCASCDGPYTKYFLVKKVRTEECPTVKCVPGVAPGCAGCGGW